MNKNWSYVPFSQIINWQEKSKIKSGDGKTTGKYKMFVCSDTLIKRYDESLINKESLIFGTGGKACIHYCDEQFTYSTDCVVACKKDNYSGNNLKFYYYYLRQNRMQLLQKDFTGSGLQHTSKKKIGALSVPLPTVEEQNKIVAKIEELFSELDKAVDTLQNIKKQLAVYRQAVLKEAFDRSHRNIENLQMLTINKMLTSDKKGMTTGPFGTMLKKHEHQSKGIPVLGIENIRKGKFVKGNKIFVTEEKSKELKAFSLKPKDIIISRSGTVGELCVIPDYMDNALLSTNLIRVSLNPKIINADYFVWLFQSKGIVVEQIRRLCKGSTRSFINQSILKQIVFPVPQLDIQHKIVDMIESRFSVCDNIEKTIDTALLQSEALIQTILKQAFEGELIK